MKIYQSLGFMSFVMAATLLLSACGKKARVDLSSPSATFATYIAAHEAQDVEAFKQTLSKQSLAEFERSPESIKDYLKRNQPGAVVLHSCCEKIQGNYAIIRAHKSLETLQAGDGRPQWLIRENGEWKLLPSKYNATDF